MGASKDAKGFMLNPYRGDKNLANNCQNSPRMATDPSQDLPHTICVPTTAASQKTYYDYVTGFIPECSGAYVSISVYFNHESKQLSGWLITGSIDSFEDNACVDNFDTKTFVKKLDNILNNSVSRQNLSPKEEENLQSFDVFVANFNFL